MQTVKFSRVKELNKEKRMSFPQKTRCQESEPKKNHHSQLIVEGFVLLLLMVTNGGAHSFIRSNQKPN